MVKSTIIGGQNYHETFEIDEGAMSSLVSLINNFCKLRYVVPWNIGKLKPRV